MKKLVILNLDNKHTQTKDFKKFLEILSKNENIILDNKNNINNQNTYLITDNSNEVKIAKNKGIHTAIITQNCENKKLIINSGAELIIEDFQDLETWLIWLGLEKDPKGVKTSTYMLPETAIDHIHVARNGTDLQEE